ncbi:MAG TPA: GlsB/YeaQ/YmgE family stress response membrane protein [Micromonosporaceae bacterium]|nr:GlsB/YeaQ/YmgE family stress response membrane protein [Micromonosporaceae bacterium]
MSWFWDAVWAVVAGAIIGVLARLILPGRQNISVLLTVIVGIVAAELGSLLARWIGVGETRGYDWIRHGIQLLLAVIGVALVAGMRRPASKKT